MKTMTVSGKTVDEAIQIGLKDWAVPEDRVKVRVIEEPVKGFFGLIGSKDATVELTLIPDALEEAEAFLSKVLTKMNLDITIEKEQHEEHAILNMIGGELGIVIGRRGQTLDALQYLVNIVANRRAEAHYRIILDAENFRQRRKETLENLALRLAKKVIRSGKETVLEPMSPADRKVIHMKLQNDDRVVTYSRGTEPNRRIVIDTK